MIFELEKIKKIAFADCITPLPEGIVSEADIGITLKKHIVPIIGQKTLSALNCGKYSENLLPIVEVALCAALRVECDYRLSMLVGGLGMVVLDSSQTAQPTTEQLRQYRSKVVCHRNDAISALSAYLEEHKGDFEEYCSENNILNRCKIYGGIIQVR